MSTIRNYIIIDDDPTNNIICNIMLEMVLGKVGINTFEKPEQGLLFIKKNYSKKFMPAVLFLDINMPTLTGWEFMEEFEKLGKEVKEQIGIYILSSSVDSRDKDKARANKHIKGFISKPLDEQVILSVAGVD
ncbi:MAG: response regulator [Ginsengibacter sp.]